jgi:DNA polymerase-3 subunit delta'
VNRDELPWHTEALRQRLSDRGRLPHGLLVLGPAGIGKTRFLEALAAALLCESPAPDGRACGRCDACGWVAADSHPDLRVIDLTVDDDGKRAREIRIEQLRAIADFLVVGSHRGGYRVVLVHPADALNAVTANALLKTLEEPTPGLLFLLASARPDAIPPTIRSRCQVFALRGPGPAEAVAWVREQNRSSEADATQWLALAGGAPLRAVGFAEPAVAAAHRAMLEAIASLPDTAGVVAAEALHMRDPRIWLPLLQRWLTDLGRCRAGAGPRYFPGHAARLAELAARCDPRGLAEAGRALAAQYRHVDHPLNARLFCEESIERFLEAFARAPAAAGG